MDNLNKEEAKRLINNLDLNKIRENLIDIAFENNKKTRCKDTIVAVLSTIDSKVHYRCEGEVNSSSDILIASYNIKPFYFDYEAEDILDGEALNEYLSIIEDEESEFFEEDEYALEYILDKYSLDKDELAKEYFKKSYIDNVLIADY